MGEMPALSHFRGSTRSPSPGRAGTGCRPASGLREPNKTKRNETKPQTLSIGHRRGPFGGLGESEAPEAPTVVGERTALARAA